MKFHKILVAIAFLTANLPNVQAHEPGSDEVVFVPRKIYFSNSFDGALITMGIDNGTFPLNAGVPTTVSTPRFTYFLNTGFNLNYDFGHNVGLFTGLGLKNIGFIEKIKPVDSTIKRRVFAVGLPLGIKVGNLKKKTYGFIGGGIDFPLNYREKGYIRRGNKTKFNEWLSDRTPSTMTYVFAGVSASPGIYLKVQYYPGNFLNPNYSETIVQNGAIVNSRPYALHNVSLLMFSIGFDIRYTNKMKIKHKDHPETMM